MWTVWDKKSEINGFSADFIFERNKHLVNEDVIYIKTVNEQVTEIEGKKILADHYGIDPNIPDEEFIAVYEAILNQPTDPDELSDSEALAIIRGETV